MEAIEVALFPSAGSVHVFAAQDEGRFEAAGLDVTVDWVTSSDHQIAGWDAGRYAVMHTAPDHLLRTGRERRPTIVRAGGIGELAVYHRPDVDLATARWGVDGPGSAFALVLRALVEDVAEVAVDPEELVPVGGTKERLQALLDGEVDGTTLSPPFSQQAEGHGLSRLAGHLDVLPRYLTTVVIAARDDLDSPWLQTYLDVVTATARELGEAGTGRIAEVLRRRGWGAEVAEAAARGVQGPAGIERSTQIPTIDDLQSVISLRQRFFPDWAPPTPVAELLP